MLSVPANVVQYGFRFRAFWGFAFWAVDGAVPDAIGNLSRHISVADAAIARLSTIRTTQLVTALREANAAVGADVVPHVGDAGEVDSHCAYSGTGAFRDTNRAGFIWEVHPDLTPPEYIGCRRACDCVSPMCQREASDKWCVQKTTSLDFEGQGGAPHAGMMQGRQQLCRRNCLRSPVRNAT